MSRNLVIQLVASRAVGRPLAAALLAAVAAGVGPVRGGESRAGAALPKVTVSADGRGFRTADGKPFVPWGVNYFRPGTGWAPKVWKQFDAEATRRDFAVMKGLGVNCVRVFLTYGSFFTSPDRLDPEGLAKLDQFLEIAEEAGIYVHPTGPDHWEGIPDWVPRDRIADERALAALEQFWRILAARYRGRSVLFAYDLLNEPSVPWATPAMRAQWNPWLQTRYAGVEALATAWDVPAADLRWGEVEPPADKEPADSKRLLDYQRFREHIADQWTGRQVAAIKKQDSEALVTVGMIQWSVPVILPSVRQYAAFRPQRQAPLLDFLEIHFYPLASGFYEYTPDGEVQNLAYVQSLVCGAAAWGKPVVVAEFGWYGGGRLTINEGRHPPASEEDQARWCRSLVETTAGPATGWLNWGLYDHPESRDVTQLTGLLTADGQPKAWGREFWKLAARWAQQPVAARESPPRPDFDWDRCIVDPSAGRDYLRRYTEQFRAVKR